MESKGLVNTVLTLATLTSNFKPIRLLDPGFWQKFTYLMTNSADTDQLASSEANWSGSTLFAKTGDVVLSKGRVKALAAQAESAHFAYVGKHFFTWLGRYSNFLNKTYRSSSQFHSIWFYLLAILLWGRFRFISSHAWYGVGTWWPRHRWDIPEIIKVLVMP